MVRGLQRASLEHRGGPRTSIAVDVQPAVSVKCWTMLGRNSFLCPPRVHCSLIQGSPRASDVCIALQSARVEGHSFCGTHFRMTVDAEECRPAKAESEVEWETTVDDSNPSENLGQENGPYQLRRSFGLATTECSKTTAKAERAEEFASRRFAAIAAQSASASNSTRHRS